MEWQNELAKLNKRSRWHGFIEFQYQEPGTLNGCKGDLAQLVWPSKVKSSLWQITIHDGFVPSPSPRGNKLTSSWKCQWNPCVVDDFYAAEKHFFLERGSWLYVLFVFSLGMKSEACKNRCSPPDPLPEPQPPLPWTQTVAANASKNICTV